MEPEYSLTPVSAVSDGRLGVGARVVPTDSEDEAAGFSAAAGESEIFSGLEGGVGERECAEANFATRAARTRISSFSADVSKFEMLRQHSSRQQSSQSSVQSRAFQQTSRARSVLSQLILRELHVSA